MILTLILPGRWLSLVSVVEGRFMICIITRSSFTTKALELRPFLVAQMVKNPPAMWETWIRSLIPGLERSLRGGHGNPLQYSCLENPLEQRNLVSYSPWGCKELDMTEWPSIAQHRKHNIMYKCNVVIYQLVVNYDILRNSYPLIRNCA